MNLHEYQSKRLFAEYGIPVPRGIPVKSPNAAVDAAKELGGDLWVVKAQVHAGGRGKAGGVKLARSRDEVREYAEGMLGKQLVTQQSGPEGLPVKAMFKDKAGSFPGRMTILGNPEIFHFLVIKVSGSIPVFSSQPKLRFRRTWCQLPS